MISTHWWKRSNSDPIRLIELLDAQDNEEIAELALRKLIEANKVRL